MSVIAFEYTLGDLDSRAIMLELMKKMGRVKHHAKLMVWPVSGKLLYEDATACCVRLDHAVKQKITTNRTTELT